jgi:DNA-binding XRE family transcriptional regulator
MERIELISQLDALVQAVENKYLSRELDAVAHKLRHPMADILAKVPGETLTDRSKAIGVSRQTMYVWADERFRPTLVQAKRIAKITDEPVENIMDLGGKIDPRRTSKPNTARVAKGRKAKGVRTGRVPGKKRGMVVGKSRTRSTAKVHKRTRRSSHGAE